MVTAAAAGEVDTLVQFQVVGGEALFDNPDFTVVGFPTATHRQIWMRCDTGQFADKRGAPGARATASTARCWSTRCSRVAPTSATTT